MLSFLMFGHYLFPSWYQTNESFWSVQERTAPLIKTSESVRRELWIAEANIAVICSNLLYFVVPGQQVDAFPNNCKYSTVYIHSISA